MSSVWYITREEVKAAADIKETARNNLRVDNAIEGASAAIEGLLHRKFYPEVATRYFDWPNQQYARPWRLWLDQNEVISITSITSGGVALSSQDYFLEPANDGPPYTRIEIDLGRSAAFQSDSTHQRAIEVAGVFGYRADESAAGIITAGINASVTTVNVSDCAAIGVGQLIRIDNERMIVREKRMLDTGQNLGTNIDGMANSVTISVADGSTFNVGEVILIDSERMLIVDIAGNNLAVKRAWDGSLLTAHTATADIYAPRTMVVDRAVLGTEASSHSSSASVWKHRVPGLIRLLALAEALHTLNQESTGYAGKSASSSESRLQTFGVGLEALRKEAFNTHGRKMRKRAV